MEKTMSAMCAVKDLAVGDAIQVEGFDGNLTVRSAKKIKKGLDAGKLQVTLVTPEGETEVMGFDPEEQVKVVGKDAAGGKGPGNRKSRTGDKGKGKGKAKAKPERGAQTAAAPQPDSPDPKAPAPEPARTQAETPKRGRRPQQAAGAKKLSALDAAAKVLRDTGTAMNCQELIRVMAEKGLWTSPGGKTPAATLYSAILKETQTKGKEARFQKTERGKFAAARAQ
jgi:hypothetical protein